jgi:hypothetical protein
LDVNRNFSLGHFLDFSLEFINLRSLLANDDPGAGRADSNFGAITCALDLYFGDTGMIEFPLDIPTDEDVFLKEFGVNFLRVPSRIPGFHDPQA